MEVGALDSNIDTRLHDHVALAEIELYSEVLTAVAVADRDLTMEELDAVLGVLPNLRTDRIPAGPDPASDHDHRCSPRRSPR